VINFGPTNISGGNLVGPITLTLGDGTVLSLPDTGAATFRGFVTDGPALTSVFISGNGVSQWPTVDHLYVGQAAMAPVPAPGALCPVILGAGLLSRRLRRKTA
jgi:hypothetical protein